jgi:HlyD family secretion protein
VLTPLTAIESDFPIPFNPKPLYVARIARIASEVARIQGFVPTPGMPAEVYIRTAERTFFEYLLQPLRDSMTGAFKES